VALSEKTFRALVTPRLWTLYSGKHSVAYLRSLGFDVMDDLIDHNSYDTLSHNQDKVTEFIAASNPMVKRFDWQDIENRCNQAAEHNQNILSQFKQQWPDDFATWLQQFVQQV